MNKKATIIVGVSSEITYSTATRLARLAGENYHIDEREEVLRFIQDKHYDELCLDKWLAPIKDKIIIDLLNQTEEAFNNENIVGVIISGSFCLDRKIKDIYMSILKEQGYEVSVVPVYSTWAETMSEAIRLNIPMKNVAEKWDLFNEQFSRIYKPNKSLPKAVIIDSRLFFQEVTGNEELIAMIQALNGSGYKVICFSQIKEMLDVKQKMMALFNSNQKTLTFSDQKFELQEKKNLFWSLVYHHHITLILEMNADCVLQWRQIKAPTISFCNEFALEKNNVYS